MQHDRHSYAGLLGAQKPPIKESISRNEPLYLEDTQMPGWQRLPPTDAHGVVEAPLRKESCSFPSISVVG